MQYRWKNGWLWVFYRNKNIVTLKERISWNQLFLKIKLPLLKELPNQWKAAISHVKINTVPTKEWMTAILWQKQIPFFKAWMAAIITSLLPKNYLFHIKLERMDGCNCFVKKSETCTFEIINSQLQLVS